MERTPRVSIGMPVYNGAALIGSAIESILAQTFGDFELIISDNASTDATEAVVRECARRDERIRYTRNEKNLGAAPNFNRLVGLARAPLFKWAAHDDLIHPTFLQKTVAMMDSAPASVALVCTRRQYIDMDGRLVDNALMNGNGWTPCYHRISFGQLLKVSPGHFPIFTWGLNRLEALKRTRLLGGYVWSDLVLAAELRLLGEFWEVPEALYYQRLHPPKVRRQGRVEAMYLNTASRNRAVVPGINLFTQHLRAISGAPVPTKQKAKCLAAMGGYLSARLNRALLSGTLNKHLWGEARLVADALGIVLRRQFHGENGTR